MAVVTKYDLYDILKNNVDDYHISATNLDNVTVDIISSADAKKFIVVKYGEFVYSVLKGSTATLAEASDDFHEMFRIWVTNRQHNIDKMYQALFDYDYSPIENTDRYETETTNSNGSTAYGHIVTDSGTDTTTYNSANTKTGTDTNTISGSEVDTNEKSGFNTADEYTKDTKHTLQYNNRTDSLQYNNTDSKTGNDATTYGKRTTNSGNDITSDNVTRTLHTHGNIGLSTNTQLITDELRLRIESLAEMLINNFIKDYCYYCD